MALSLIAFDTDHIKGYVFGTYKLKEIRGASALLDRLNRKKMVDEAKKFGAEKIFAHGGSGLFLVDTERAKAFGDTVQKMYHESTKGGASITYAIQPLDKVGTDNKEEIKEKDLQETLALLRWRLRKAKNSPHEYIVLPSHPFMKHCDACGIFYAEDKDTSVSQDPDEQNNRYCSSCKEKREEDAYVKELIRKKEPIPVGYLWGHIQDELRKVGYKIPLGTQRPSDFNVFSQLEHSTGYLGLIYADANGMGKVQDKFRTLKEIYDFAKEVDDAVFSSMAHAIKEHLPLQKGLFPFDILLIGGDDIVMVTPAAKALQVAHTLAEQFHASTKQKYTLSVGIVLAPIKYPFNLQQTLAEDTLKAAKKAGAEHSHNNKQEQTRINFVVVTGSTSLSYQKIDEEFHRKKVPSSSGEEFHATLRPYTLSQLKNLLDALQKGNKEHLGRTKLHQLREAILKLNRTTTILEALALLRNWKTSEKKFIKDLIDNFDPRTERDKRIAGTLFPWYIENQTIYRTPLLDFIELYDFVSPEPRSIKAHDPQ